MGKKPDRDDAETKLAGRKFAWLKQVNADGALKPDSAFKVAAAIMDNTYFDKKLRPEEHFCFPSMETLGERTGGLSERTVRTCIAALRERGHLHVKPGPGRNNSNRYWMVLAGEKTCEFSHGLQHKPCEDPHLFDAETLRVCAGNPASLRQKPCENSPPNPSSDPSSHPKKARKRAGGVLVFDEDLGVRAEVARGYIEHRKAKKAPLTGYALTLLCNELRKLKQAGRDPNDALDLAIKKGWRGLEAKWILEPRKGDGAPTEKRSAADVAESFLRRQRAREQVEHLDRERQASLARLRRSAG